MRNVSFSLLQSRALSELTMDQIQVTGPDERAPVEDARGQGPDRHGAGREGQPAAEEARLQNNRRATAETGHSRKV